MVPPIKKNGFKVPVPAPTPPKIVLVAVEGWGKTSLGAAIDGASILMPSTETGYMTLLGAGRVPARPAMVTETWTQTTEAVKEFSGKSLVLDELTGFERQCKNYVMANEFDNSRMKFDSWQKGIYAVEAEWTKFLLSLERLKLPVLMLSHAKVETFNDPFAAYSRYVSAAQKNVWGSTLRWADLSLFGTFKTIINSDGKGVGGKDRIIHAEHSDAVDAKNRYGFPSEIICTGTPEEICKNIFERIAK